MTRRLLVDARGETSGAACMMSSTRTNPADPSLDDSFALAGYLEIYAGDYMETAVRQATAELEGLLTPERY